MEEDRDASMTAVEASAAVSSADDVVASSAAAVVTALQALTSINRP